MFSAMNQSVKRHLPFLGLCVLALLIIGQTIFYFQQRSHLDIIDKQVEHSEAVIDRTIKAHGLVAEVIKTGSAAEEKLLLRQIEEIRTLAKHEPDQQKNIDNFYTLSLALIKDMAGEGRTHYDAMTGDKKAYRAQMLYDLHLSMEHIMSVERKELREYRPAARHKELQLINILLAIVGITYTAVLAAFTVAVLTYLRIQDIKSELEKKDAQFRAAADGSISAFLLFEKQYDDSIGQDRLVLEYINRPGYELWDLSSADIGRVVEDVFAGHHQNADEIEEIYYGAFRSGASRELTYEISEGVGKGRSIFQQVIVTPGGIAVSSRDVTESKQIERMKNEFVSIVSHELRTPLTSIRGSLGLIMGGIAGSVSDQAKDLVTIAYNNCERLVRLINDILDIEKIESGRMIFESRPLSLLPLLRQAIIDNKAYADRYAVEFILDESGGNEKVQIYADADRVAQVLANLLSNAAKFSPRKSKVTVRYAATGDMIRVEVEDKGHGIPLEFQKHVFEKFAQADGSDSRQKGGTGLGLSIVKAIVEEMKGRVGFETTPNVGTVFYFTLPTPTPETHLISSEPRDAAGARQRILVCEDDADIASLLTMIFERLGLDVDLATCAIEAQQLLEKRTYLAMTLDLMLPDKDGVAFIRELREDPCFTDLPIIVISVKAEEGRKQFGGDAIGVVDWLVKPIDVKKLVGLVQGLRLGRPRILHVEDDPGLAEVLRLSLLPVADVVLAADFQSAREKIMTEDFDLAVVDVGLPDGVGTDLLPYLGSQGRGPVPVILFTATEVPSDMSARVAAALIKSRTSEERLLDTIQRIIAEHRTDLKRKDAA